MDVARIANLRHTICKGHFFMKNNSRAALKKKYLHQHSYKM